MCLVSLGLMAIYILSCLVGLLLTLIFIPTFRGCKRGPPGRLPPGPLPYPLIGNLLELGEQPHRSLAKLANVYGPIMCLKLGQVTTIVVSSASMAKEFLQTHDLIVSTHRARPDAFNAYDFGDYSIVSISISNHWKILRKAFTAHMFSNKKLDDTRHVRCKKVEELIAKVEANCRAGIPIDIGQLAFKTMLNFFSYSIFSVDLIDPNSDTAQGFKEIVWGFMEEGGRPNIADCFPVLRFFDPQRVRHRMTNHLRKLLEVLSELVEERMRLREATGATMENDILDIILNLYEDKTEGFRKEWIERIFLDIFLGGNDTASTTVEWAMAELLHNPDSLSKAKAELNEVVGRNNMVQESDIARLPYINAVLKETLRLHSTVPFLVPRVCGADIEVCGYRVPEGAQVIINAWAIGRDPNTWNDSNLFKPERFLESEIDFKGNNFELIPFGAGRRICPGMRLAVKIVPLMLASLVHSFNWKLPDGVKPDPVDMDDKFGLTLKIKESLLAIPSPA